MDFLSGEKWVDGYWWSCPQCCKEESIRKGTVLEFHEKIKYNFANGENAKKANIDLK